MSNYHVEPAAKPAGPDQGGDQVAAQGAGPGPLASPADARRAGHRHRAVARRGRCRDHRLHLAQPVGRLRCTDSASATFDDVKLAEQHAPDRGRLPGLLRRGALVRGARATRPSSASSPARTRPVTGPRSMSARCTSAARTLAASQTRANELLARMPVPWFALRPARHQGGRAGVRARAARHGSLQRSASTATGR